MKLVNKSAMSAVVAMSATAVLFGQVATTTPTTASVALAANTLLVMGGNGNPDGVNMEKELNGEISTNKGTTYDGYTFTPVKWSAQTPISTGADGTFFNVSQAEGLEKINAALAKAYTPGQKLVIVGYSSSASVVSKQINSLQATRAAGDAASTPSTDDLSFIVFGNPTRPNGGFFSRYPGYKIGPPLGVDFQEPLAPSDYKVTDVCRQYDGFCDYPVDPTNMLAIMNTAFGMYFDHGDYFNVDINNKDGILRDETVGNTRFITVKNTLPILRFMPSFLAAPLDAFLRPQIEAAYDRTSSLGTPTTSKVSAANDPLLNLVNTYLRLFGGSGSGTQTPVAPNTVTAKAKQVSSKTTVAVEPTTETVESTTPESSTPASSTPVAPITTGGTTTSSAPVSTTPDATTPDSPATPPLIAPSTDNTTVSKTETETPAA